MLFFENPCNVMTKVIGSIMTKVTGSVSRIQGTCHRFFFDTKTAPDTNIR